MTKCRKNLTLHAGEIHGWVSFSSTMSQWTGAEESHYQVDLVFLVTVTASNTICILLLTQAAFLFEALTISLLM